MQVELRFPGKKIVAFAMMVIISLSSVVTVAAATVTATVHYGDKSYSVQVLSTDTSDILKQAHLQIGPEDIVTRDDSNGIVITIKKAFQVPVTADGKKTNVTLYTGDTVQTALAAAKVQVEPDDIVSAAVDEILSEGDKVSVIRQYHISVEAEGISIHPLVTEGTVESAIKKAGVVLGKDDLVTPSRNEKISEGMSIKVQRVTYRETVSTEKIDYKTVEQETEEMLEGDVRVTTPGQQGEQTVTSREMLIDGVVYERKTLSTLVTKEPVNEVALVGTKEVEPDQPGQGEFIDKDGNIVAYKQLLSGKCSAYTSNGGHTATGKKAQYGLVAVDPSVIPYGTKLYIASADGRTVYGYAIAADTGGAMLSGRILVDLYYDTEAQCYNFGIRHMNVYVL